jgi:hypothetical protein
MNKKQKELISEASFNGEAIGLTSKMWIMKNGKVFSTGGNWHFQWAFQNRKMLEDKYGISFEGISEKDDEQKVRVHLIKQGMFRLNHESRGNRVTIEGVINYFNKRVKDTVVALVMDNDESISNLSIVLFDNGVETVVKRKFANFFNIFGREKVEKTIDMINEKLYKSDDDLIWENYQNNQKVINESSLSRLEEKMRKYKCICVSAFRGENTYAENKSKSKELLAYLLDKKYSVTRVNGSFIENMNEDNEQIVSEETWFVADDQELYSRTQMIQDIFNLGKNYKQDSILVINQGGKTAYLLGTSKTNNFPEFGKKVDVGSQKFGGIPVKDEQGNIIEKGKIAGEFFTRLKGNRSFAFENIQYPQTINGIRGLRIVAEKVKKELGEIK